MKGCIVLGVSGGVDSCLAAFRLRKKGFRVTAVHLDMHGMVDERDSTRLAMLAEEPDIEVVDIDCRACFADEVVRPFIDGYAAATTPNPCVLCNEHVKVRLLVNEAEKRDISLVATGHYASRGVYQGREALLHSGTRKDQTYMLYRLPPEWIPHLVFPLSADRDKESVRKALREYRPDMPLGGESSDICFVSGDFRSYLESALPSESIAEGAMIDSRTGEEIGRHHGLPFYTEGMRKGLGLSCGPWFVRGRDAVKNELILDHGVEPVTCTVHFKNAVWQQPVYDGKLYSFKFCYRCPVAHGRIIFDSPDKNSGTVEMTRSWSGVSPGQSIVFYDGAVLLGGGFITK